MNLLFIVPYAPTRIRTRPHYFLRFLARKGHRITLASLWQNEEEKAALQAIESWGVRVLAFPTNRFRRVSSLVEAGITGLPFQSRYNWEPQLGRAIAAELESCEPYDLVHVEHLRGAVYGTRIKRQNGAKPMPVVWDSVDCISHLFQQSAAQSSSRFGRLSGRIELNRTRKYESRMVQTFDRVLVTSENDRRALLALDPAAGVAGDHICVVPNGVDMEDFHPVTTGYEPDTLVFTGKMSYHANITAVTHFVRNILPLIWEKRPQTRFWIVGKDPGREIKNFAQDSRIKVFGTVPEIAPILGTAAVAVAPIAYGAGIQNKVLEAMACRVPVVCSPLAVSAIAVSSGKELLVAGDSRGFADSVLELLENQLKREEIAEAGYNYVLNHHDWGRVTSDLEDVYNETIHTLA